MASRKGLIGVHERALIVATKNTHEEWCFISGPRSHNHSVWREVEPVDVLMSELDESEVA